MPQWSADRLGTTQPAVSHAVRGIERRLGVVLFERGGTGRGAPGRASERWLTPGGSCECSRSGPLRIAAFRSAALYLLPPSWNDWVTDLGPRRPTRRVGYVTTPEPAATAAVRALVRELRSLTKVQVSTG